MSKFDELTEKLREIFQIDRPDLDFGIYRIVGARRAEIDDFLTNRLKTKVQVALAEGAAADQAQLSKQLADAEALEQQLGVPAGSSEKVRTLRAQLAAGDTSARENAVFSHLLTFFSRYYDKGDFISQRRYKGDTYAIPYAGEEVVLHWANKDQYYTKSGELFANYGFTLGAGPMTGKRVLFKLVAADTAKDNRKSAEKNWAYALTAPRIVTSLDEDGETVEAEIVPVAQEGDELVIRFEYGPQAKGVKQADLLSAAAQAILADPAAAGWVDGLKLLAPTESNKARTLLEKHLTDYAAKNTADYFIHKDLGRFLRQELDFYIKSDVMRLDDIQEAGAFDDIAANLRMIQCLRAIALELITFLAQIEDFQKKLWLKKKFVVSAHWCVTLDRVPTLHGRIAANTRQWQAWRDLGVWDGADGTSADLAKRPYMMVDTSLFDPAFRADVLKALPSLDHLLNGTIVQGDNFQSINLLSGIIGEKVNCTYIDPPYNSPSSRIIYKNNYLHSSWLSLMQDRLVAWSHATKGRSPIAVAIDKYEENGLKRIMEQMLTGWEVVSVAIEHNKKGVQGDGFSFNHEHTIFSFRKETHQINRKEIEEADRDWSNLRNWGGESERSTAKTCFYPILVKDDKIIGFGPVCPDDFHPPSANVTRADGVVEVYPIDKEGVERKWRYGRDTVNGIFDLLRVARNRRKMIEIEKAQADEAFKTLWYGTKYNAGDWGTRVLTNLGFPKTIFQNPKSVFTVADCVSAISNNSAFVLDFFAGSGTTAHAAINLNRQDAGERKYILVDQGEYLIGLIKPRIQKVVYSADWDEGKPTSIDSGISHALKILKIESYEDTLNNLSLKRTPNQELALDAMPSTEQDAYRMRYMLDVESRGSLLNVDQFRKPWDYKLDIATDSAGASEPVAVDLIETFNYLLGLTVDTIDINLDRGFATVTGWEPGVPNTPENRTLIIWRDCDMVDDAGLHALTRRLAINPGDAEYRRVFVNGDHSLPSVIESDDGGETAITLLPIEPEFLARMWDVKDI